MGRLSIQLPIFWRYSGHFWIHLVITLPTRRVAAAVWSSGIASRVGPIPGSAKMTIWTNGSPTKKLYNIHQHTIQISLDLDHLRYRLRTDSTIIVSLKEIWKSNLRLMDRCSNSGESKSEKKETQKRKSRESPNDQDTSPERSTFGRPTVIKGFHLAKSVQTYQNVFFLWHLLKQWQVWDV